MKKYITDSSDFSEELMEGSNFYVSQAQTEFEEIDCSDKKKIIKIDEKIFEEAKKVSNEFPKPEDGLFSLFKNEGSADPFIIASAIIKSKENPSDEWIIISKDKAIQRICQEKGIKCLTREELDKLNQTPTSQSEFVS